MQKRLNAQCLFFRFQRGQLTIHGVEITDDSVLGEFLPLLTAFLHQLLTQKGITPILPHIGEYATSMEMAGLSVTVMALDDELEQRLIREGHTK